MSSNAESLFRISLFSVPLWFYRTDVIILRLPLRINPDDLPPVPNLNEREKQLA